MERRARTERKRRGTSSRLKSRYIRRRRRRRLLSSGM
jgi:hypothetical protein